MRRSLELFNIESFPPLASGFHRNLVVSHASETSLTTSKRANTQLPLPSIRPDYVNERDIPLNVTAVYSAELFMSRTFSRNCQNAKKASSDARTCAGQRFKF